MRHAIITGGGSGIGQAIALRMAQDGDHLVILDLQQDAGDETVGMIKQAGGSAECLECDVFVQLDNLNFRDTADWRVAR